MEQVTRYNGNNTLYTVDMPKIIILAEHINDVALNHIRKNTGLDFIKKGWLNNYEAQPTTHTQLTALFLTYNFKTQYNDNANIKNSLLLKFVNNEEFKK